MSKDYLTDFVLVGGTALSLQIGHRTSIDLDLFTNVDYAANEKYDLLLKDFELAEALVNDRSTLIIEIEGVKVDLIKFKYPFRAPIIEVDNIRLLSIEDIAPMKIDAITGRGKKKDFYDLYFLIQYFSLPQILQWYDQMFHHVTMFHVWKSLTYFEDAEGDADPLVFDKSITWPKVKSSIEAVVRQL